jgi:arylsulfatase A-like enzyme
MDHGEKPRSFRSVIWLTLAAGVLLLVVEVVAPALIAQAYRGESLEALNRVFQGRDQHSLDVYLREWERLSKLAWPLAAMIVGGVALWQWRLAALVRPFLVAQPVLGPGRVLWTAAWFGAVTGFVEAALMLNFRGHPARGFAWEKVWMAPLASILAFIVVALALLLLTRASGSTGKWLAPVAMRLAVFVFCGLAVYAIAGRPQFGLVTAAAVIFSAGVAVMVARYASADGHRFVRVVQATSGPVGALLLITSAFGAWMLPASVERRRLAELRPVGDRPNILLIVLDTERASSMSLYGYQRETTRHLRKFARGGVVFNRAIATAPWTLPSHASMFTGRYPHEMTADIGVPLDETHRTLAEVLSENGYATAGFVANYFYTTEASGLARGFARYEDYPINVATFIQSSWLATTLAARPLKRFARSGAERDEGVTDSFLRWQSTRGTTPYFAFLNYMGAHAPYPSSGDFRGPRGQAAKVRKQKGITERDLEGARAAYDNGIVGTDEEIGRLLSEIDLDETVVVITSDHGEHLGEHGLQEHTNSLYMPLLHVPLVIAYPDKVPEGMRVPAAVTLRDIPATLLELVGVPSDSDLGGKSLTRYWTRDPDGLPAEPVLSELNYWGEEQDIIKPWDPVYSGSMKSLVLGNLHYIRNEHAVEEVFDLDADPGERSNLIGRLAPEVLQRLRATLDSIISAHEPKAIPPS